MSDNVRSFALALAPTFAALASPATLHQFMPGVFETIGLTSGTSELKAIFGFAAVGAIAAGAAAAAAISTYIACGPKKEFCETSAGAGFICGVAAAAGLCFLMS